MQPDRRNTRVRTPYATPVPAGVETPFTNGGESSPLRRYSWTSKRNDFETIFHSPSILTRLRKSVK